MTPRLTTVPLTADLVHGAVEVETTPDGRLRPHRLPAAARARNADPQLATAETMPAGVRLRLRTSATAIELVTHVTRRRFAGIEPPPEGRYEVLVDGAVRGSAPATGGSHLRYDLAAGTVDLVEGEPGPVRFTGLPATDKEVEIRLPHGELAELVELRADAPVRAVERPARRTWVHHGSSISQGSNASTPSAAWPVAAADRGEVELVNLGFSGSAMLDPFVARTIRDLPADLISVKAGINIVGGDVMRLRVFGPLLHGFLDTVREGHPDLPLLVVTPLLCPMHEDTPGPSGVDPDAFAAGRIRYRATGDPADVAAGRLSLRSVRAETERVVAERQRTDPHLHLLDGLALYGAADIGEHPLPDGLHPDTGTHELVGARFAERVFGAGGPFTP